MTKSRTAVPVDTPRTIETTVNLHKRCFSVVFKKKAKRAIEEIRKVAEHIMKTKDVRVDSNLNKFVWHKGVRNVPRRVRVRLERKINEDEEAANKTYTVVSHVEVDSFKAEKKGEKGLTTVVVANEA